MEDTRAKPRTRFDDWVEVEWDGHRARGAGVDLSVAGLGLALPEGGVALGGRVISEFPLPGIALPVEVAGRWAWVDPSAKRAGIRFESVDPGIADLLANFVAGRL